MLPHNNRLENFLHKESTHEFISILIVLNAIILGLATSRNLNDQHSAILWFTSHLIIIFFAAELVIRLIASGFRFFKNGWNIFDFLIILLSLIPGIRVITILRSFRVFRLTRVISLSTRIHMIVESLKHAVPGIITIAIILISFFYMFAVVSCNLFGDSSPLYFGTLSRSMFTLFQLMISDSFGSIVRNVSKNEPYAFLFFIPYMLIMAFTVLNLFFGLVVTSMQFAAEASKPYMKTLDKKERIAELQRQIEILQKEI